MGEKDRIEEAATASTGDVPDSPSKVGTERPVKTFYLGWDLHGMIERKAAEWKATESEAARWLLRKGLETGKVPPLETVTKAQVD